MQLAMGGGAATEHKLIMHMKGTEVKGWAGIQEALEDIMGSKLVGGTLRKRYTRMKASFVVFEKEDVGDTASHLPFLLLHISMTLLNLRTDKRKQKSRLSQGRGKSKRNWRTRNSRELRTILKSKVGINILRWRSKRSSKRWTRSETVSLLSGLTRKWHFDKGFVIVWWMRFELDLVLVFATVDIVQYYKESS